MSAPSGHARPCDRCGHDHVATQGGRPCMGHHSPRHETDPGGACTARAMRGQDVCRVHGGSAPQAKAAAARRLVEADAVKLMRRFGEPVDTTPTEALLDSVRWTAGYVAWLREKVAQVADDDALVWGLTRDKTGGEDRGQTSEAKPNVWLGLLGEWHDRLVRICADAIKVGIEERRVRLAEAQGDLLAQVIRGILADLNLNPEQEELVATVVPKHLRLVA